MTRFRSSRVPAVSRWCGHVGWPVTTPSGAELGMLEVKLRFDSVAVYLGARELGQIDRARLRRWFAKPNQTLVFDDVKLALKGRTLMMGIGLAPPSAVPLRESAQLLAVV